MKVLVIVSIFAVAIGGAGCSARTEQASSRETMMKRVEERQQRRREEIERAKEVHEKELPEKLRTLARLKEPNKRAVAQQIVDLVPLHDANIQGSSVVQIVKTFIVEIPPFTAKIDRWRKNPIRAYNSERETYQETIDNIKLNTRARIAKTTRAPMILTTLAAHDITLKLRVVTTKYNILLEEFVFHPADVRACMEKRAIQPGGLLTPVLFENMNRPTFSEWPTPPPPADLSDLH